MTRPMHTSSVCIIVQRHDVCLHVDMYHFSD